MQPLLSFYNGTVAHLVSDSVALPLSFVVFAEVLWLQNFNCLQAVLKTIVLFQFFCYFILLFDKCYVAHTFLL